MGLFVFPVAIFIPNRYHIVQFVIAGLTRNLQQINGIAGQARNDARGYFDSGLVSNSGALISKVFTETILTFL